MGNDNGIKFKVKKSAAIKSGSSNNNGTTPKKDNGVKFRVKLVKK